MILLFISSSLLAQTTRPDPSSQEMSAITVQMRYLQYLPQGYADDPMNRSHGGDGKGWPLVMFLHGSGQRGTDLNVLKQEGLPKLVAEGREYPFILISPQCGLNEYFDAQMLLKLIDRVADTLHVDRDRIYVTGLSMGGGGTWDVAKESRGKLAAIAPICGRGDRRWAQYSQYATSLAVWAFHGADDDVIPASESEEMVQTLQAAGSTIAKLTIYPGVKHPSWRIAYDDPELYRWLLAQRRREPTTAPAKK